MIEVMRWGFGFSLCGNTVKTAVMELFEKTKYQVSTHLQNKTRTIALDGWTNPVTKEKHVCLVVQPISVIRKNSFDRSNVMTGSLSMEALYHFWWKEVITDLQAFGFTTIGITVDNARAQQAAIAKVSGNFPKCANSLWGNLILKSRDMWKYDGTLFTIKLVNY